MEPTIPPHPIPPQSVVPVPPVPVPPKNNSLSVLIIVIIFLALGSAGFFANQNMQLKKQIVQKQLIPTPTPTPDLTANWKIFTDTTNGVEFRYPQNWYAKQMAGWTFNVFLNDHNFEIPMMTEFITPIQISFNEIMDTSTNIKRYSEKTIEEAAKRIKTDIYGGNVSETDNLIIGGHKATQLVGTAGPGMLEGQYYKVTYIQMDNKVLTVALVNNKNFESIYDQILSTFKFTEQSPTGAPTPAVPADWISHTFNTYGLTMYTPNDWQSSITDFPENSESLVKFWKKSSPTIVPIQLAIKPNWDNTSYDPSQATHSIVGDNISAIRVDPPTKTQQTLERYQTNVYFEHNTKIYVFTCVHNWVQDYLDTCNTMLQTLHFTK